MERGLNHLKQSIKSALIRPALLAGACGAALSALPAIAHETSGQKDYMNGGYFLLHHLSEDEDQLPLLLDIKTAPKEIDDYAIRISKTAKETLAVLDRLQQSDPSLKFDKDPLPAVELDVRASIKDEKQHDLLFGNKGGNFVRALLVSQADASSYASNLAKVLAEHESDSDRAKSLRRISVKWAEIRRETMRLLGST